MVILISFIIYIYIVICINLSNYFYVQVNIIVKQKRFKQIFKFADRIAKFLKSPINLFCIKLL